MPGESHNTDKPKSDQPTKWDTLGEEVPFQGNQDKPIISEQEKQPQKTVGEWYSTMLDVVDLNSEDFEERFQAAEIYEDTTRYTAEPVTKITYKVDQDRSSWMIVNGRIDDSASKQIAPQILKRMQNLDIVSTENLYNIIGENSQREDTITPEELAEQYTTNEDGTLHNPTLLRIIKAKPEELFTIDKEAMEKAMQTPKERGQIYAMPQTEYYIAPVDPSQPDVIPTNGRKAVISVRSGYKPIQKN